MQHLTASWRDFNETCHYHNVSVNWQKDIQGQRSRSFPVKLTYLVVGIHFNVVIVLIGGQEGILSELLRVGL